MNKVFEVPFEYLSKGKHERYFSVKSDDSLAISIVQGPTEHVYLVGEERLQLEETGLGGREFDIRVTLSGRFEGVFVVFFLDAAGARLGHQFVTPNHFESIVVPPEVTALTFGVRATGAAQAVIHEIQCVIGSGNNNDKESPMTLIFVDSEFDNESLLKTSELDEMSFVSLQDLGSPIAELVDTARGEDVAVCKGRLKKLRCLVRANSGFGKIVVLTGPEQDSESIVALRDAVRSGQDRLQFVFGSVEDSVRFRSRIGVRNLAVSCLRNEVA